MKKLIDIAGSINLTLWLTALMVADLVWGYFSMNGHENLFRPLNEMGLSLWLATYGASYYWRTLWFAALLALLFLFCLNMFVCTTRRVFIIWQKGAKNRVRFILKFSVHIMHYGVIILLSGFLWGYLASETWPNVVAVPEMDTRLAGTSLNMRLKSITIKKYKGKRLAYMKGKPMEAWAIVCLDDGVKTGERKIGINSPFFFRGMSFHLKNFGPKSSMHKGKFVSMTVKKDPGLFLYFSGTIMILTGLGMYVYKRFQEKL